MGSSRPELQFATSSERRFHEPSADAIVGTRTTAEPTKCTTRPRRWPRPPCAIALPHGYESDCATTSEAAESLVVAVSGVVKRRCRVTESPVIRQENVDVVLFTSERI